MKLHRVLALKMSTLMKLPDNDQAGVATLVAVAFSKYKQLQMLALAFTGIDAASTAPTRAKACGCGGENVAQSKKNVPPGLDSAVRNTTSRELTLRRALTPQP